MNATLLKPSFIVLSLLAVLSVYSQDPTFSQFDPNQLYYNPAYAGYKKEARVEVEYRNLWPNVPGREFPGPLSTYSATADAYFSIHDRFTGGAGLFAMQDMEGQGFLTTSTIGLVYSQHMPHIRGRSDRQDRWNIYMGFKAYFSNIHIDWSRFVFSDQLNANYGITGPSTFDQTAINSRDYFDFDYGVVLRNNAFAKGRWYNELGFAMSHVLAPSISITGANSDNSRLPRKYVFTYRGNIAVLNNNLYFGPTVLFENQAKFYETNIGCDVYLKLNNKHETIPLSIGIYDRFSEVLKNTETNSPKINTSAIVLALTHRGNFANGKYPIGYSVGFSVDFPYMGLGMQTAGAYELTMGLLIPYKKSDKLKCPFEAY
jgi:type IX secretion system PorP/SprF family membrane protein